MPRKARGGLQSSQAGEADGEGAPAAEPSIPVDWMRADLQGEALDLSWYVARAEQGDQKAALRALALCEASLTEGSLRQNGWRMSSLLAAALRTVLAGAGREGDSTVLRVARGQLGGRGPIERDRWAKWWLCYEMYCLLQSRPTLSQDGAAVLVLGAPDLIKEIQPESLARAYRTLLSDLARYFHQSMDDAQICGPWVISAANPEE